MATSDQIDAAATASRTPSKGDGFIDRKAQHILGGAYTYEQAEHARAARYTNRLAPDLLDVLGLAPPPRPAGVIDRFGDDCLTDLLRALTAGEGDARTVLHGMNRAERDAARQALTARLRERKVRRGEH